MKTGSPWRVKGIRPQARETARQAARRRGVSVGEWLNAVIIDSAIGEGIAPARDLPPPLSFPSRITGNEGLRIVRSDLEEHWASSRRKDPECEGRRDDELQAQIANVMNRVEMLAHRFEEHQRSHLVLASFQEQHSTEQRSERRFQPQPIRQRAGSEQPSIEPRSSAQVNTPTATDEFPSSASDQALRAIKERLDALASQLERYGRLGEVTDTGSGAAKHNRGESAAANAGRIEKTRPDPTDEGLYKLRQDLHGLAQANAPDSLSALEQRIEAIDEGRPPPRQGPANPQDLEGVIARLDEGVRRLQLERTGLIAARQIQGRIEQAEPPSPEPAAAAALLRASASAKRLREPVRPQIQPAARVQSSPRTAKSAARCVSPAAQSKPQISAEEEFWWADRESSSTVEAPIGRRSGAPNPAHDRPIDTGSRTLETESASPAQRIAASEASLGMARPPVSSDSGPKPDFIAAARRAAQAASAEASLGRKDRAEADPGPARNPVSRIGKRARSLLVLAGIVMIVLASLKLGSNLLGAQHGQGDAPAEATQAAPAQDAPVPAPVRSSAGTISAAGPAQARREPVVSAAELPEPIEQRSELGSEDMTGAVPTADGVPSWLPPLPSPASPAPPPASSVSPTSSASSASRVAPVVPYSPAVPARGESTGDGALNSSRARPTGTEPGPNPPAKPSSRAATGPSPSSGSSAAPAEASRPKQGTAHPAAGEALPVGLGSNRLRAAAMNGDAAAQYEIAVRFADGRGVRQDLSAAARWFERAANQGLAPAQFRLGVFYERGTGVKKDRESARRLYSAAAEAGNARAMHNLGVLYAEGVDGKPDYSNAAKWFLNAAEYGLGDSQYNLAVLYARGIGVQTDPGESYKWFALAARKGDKEAEKKRDEIAAQLDRPSLAAARAAVAAWVAKAEPETATTVKPPAGGWDDPAAAVSKNAFNADNAAPPMR
jgi:localization factor PodJL